MSTLTPQEHEQASSQLAVAREKIKATGATALSPTPQWAILQKEISALVRKLK